MSLYTAKKEFVSHGGKCGHCYQPIEDGSSFIYWILSQASFDFHPECAEQFLVRLAADIHEYRTGARADAGLLEVTIKIPETKINYLGDDELKRRNSAHPLATYAGRK